MEPMTNLLRIVMRNIISNEISNVSNILTKNNLFNDKYIILCKQTYNVLFTEFLYSHSNVQINDHKRAESGRHTAVRQFNKYIIKAFGSKSYQGHNINLRITYSILNLISDFLIRKHVKRVILNGTLQMIQINL